MNMEDNQKSLSELLAEGMSDTPSLSRRERRALNAAGESDKKNAAKEVADDLEMNLSENPVEEEPTLEFHPVHKREEEKRAPLHKSPRKVLDDLDYEDEDDEEDEEEEDVKPSRRKEKKKDKKRYEDDEDDYDDDEDEYDDEDDDYDEDEEDEEDEDDDEEESSFVKRLLGFFKGLLAVALIVLLVVFVLRLLEAGGRISLDWLRSGVGERLPFVNSVFPKP